MVSGKQIRVYLVDGAPGGLLTAASTVAEPPFQLNSRIDWKVGGTLQLQLPHLPNAPTRSRLLL